jgi:hypothetical protein
MSFILSKPENASVAWDKLAFEDYNTTSYDIVPILVIGTDKFTNLCYSRYFTHISLEILINFGMVKLKNNLFQERAS